MKIDEVRKRAFAMPLTSPADSSRQRNLNASPRTPCSCCRDDLD
jgi:hypothetical protein